MGRNRSGVLELAVLGLLNGTPMHGYELRKRLYTVLGAFRALSYGSLYPCLHELQDAGLITAEQDENLLRKALSAKAFCVLAKPVSKNVVIYVVTRALEKYYD